MIKLIVSLFIVSIICSLNAKETDAYIKEESIPIFHITHENPSFEKINDRIIVNHYVLKVSNTNNQDTSYRFEIKNKDFSHSIKKDIFIGKNETKTIFFEVFIYSELTKKLRNIEKLEVVISDKNNQAIKAIEQIDFIVKNK